MSYLDRDTLGMYKGSSNNGPGPALMGADTLIGDDVYNMDEEELGEIKEIMLDMNSGEVAYAVLSFGGILGMGEKLFAVPWQRLSLDTVNQRFILDIDKETLKNAPGFDKDQWPDMSGADWINQVQMFYGSPSQLPSRAGTQGMGSSGSAMGGSAGGQPSSSSGSDQY